MNTKSFIAQIKTDHILVNTAKKDVETRFDILNYHYPQGKKGIG